MYWLSVCECDALVECVYSPEASMRVCDVLVERVQVSRVPAEVFERCAVLKDASDGTQSPALTRKKSRTSAELHNIKPVRSHDSRVHVAIVDEVTHDLITHTHTT